MKGGGGGGLRADNAGQITKVNHDRGSDLIFSPSVGGAGLSVLIAKMKRKWLRSHAKNRHAAHRYIACSRSLSQHMESIVPVTVLGAFCYLTAPVFFILEYTVSL